ncbi:CDP-glycerol glycerophosphotransferase family protein [Thiomicrospira microaerophila]|uniref:CDP-glycerol glycerophosphotransferase family protein n=1 Tax=Thiomicrospira microaerophila TaxID=406020 RepID=UPI001E59E869|nr:CDP-glycerol glycerophosphotransferase family protein [Thiomicrospira microaerophila]
MAWFFAPDLKPKLDDYEPHLSSAQAVFDFAPDVMFIAGNWFPYYLPGIKVMVFHGFAINKRSEQAVQLSGHFRLRGWFDLYCTHSEIDTQRFKELNDGTYKVYKTGWPKFDTLYQKKQASLHVDCIAKPSARIPCLFYASTFSPSLTSSEVLFEEIRRIIQSEKWQVIATLHPKTPAETQHKYRSLKATNYQFLETNDDLYDGMLKSDVMLCDTSTIMYEYLFFDKPLVTFNTKNPGDFAINVTDVNALEATLCKALIRDTATRNAQQNRCKDLHGYLDDGSSQRVIEAVDSFIQQGLLETLKPKKLNMLRKLKVRQKMNYWRL